MKRYARISEGVVLEVMEIVDEVDIGDLTPPGYVWMAAPDEVTDGWAFIEGRFIQPATAPEDYADVMAAKWLVVQAFMDSKAKAWGYESLASAITYADEPIVPRFQEQGRALRAWRSRVRERFLDISDHVFAKQRPVPSDASLLNDIPALE